MTKTLIKDTLRSIAANKLRFISVAIIVALGISFYVGINSASPAMKYEANEYFNRNNLMDVCVTSPIPFTDDDIEKIEKIKLFFRKEIKSENCAGTKAFSDGLKMPIQDFPRTGQSFAAAGVPDSLLKGCPMQKLFFSITQQAQKVNSLSAVLRVRGRAPHSGRRCAGWPRPVRGSPA